MRSLPALAAAFTTCAIASPLLADQPSRPSAVVAVFDFRTSGPDAATLADRVRRATKDVLPGAALVAREEIRALLPDLGEGCAGNCAVRAGRSLIADLVVSGDVSRRGEGFVLSLELRDTREGDLISTATASAANAEALASAAVSATTDLFRPLSVPASASGAPGKPATAAPPAFALGAPQLPAVPGPLGAAPEGLTVDYDVDADVLVLYDQARTADVAGAEHPEDAARAWGAVAQAPGVNPFRTLASERGEAWDSYAGKRRAYDAQRAADSARLRKVLPLKWVSDWVKLDLVERYARAYGAEGATSLVPSARVAALREKATLAIACESQDADKCAALAHLADEGNEPRVAVAYLDRACAAGSAQACSDAGNRFLAEPTRDVERAVAALRRGCDAKNAQACARLARVYEEGDTGKVDLAAAADARDKACAAGDGASCRRLACLIDTSASAAAKAHAEELWGSGCAAGDAQSCALIRAARAGAGGPAAAPPAAAGLDAAATAYEYALQRRQSLGIGLLAIGTVLGTGAAAIAFDQQAPRGHRGFPRRFEKDPPTMAYVLGAGAAASVAVGIGLLLSKPDPEPQKEVRVGVTPNGILLSGPLP